MRQTAATGAPDPNDASEDEAADLSEEQYAEAAAWAETAGIDPQSPSLVLGAEASAVGRALLRESGPGLTVR